MSDKTKKGIIQIGLPVFLSVIGFMGAGYGLFYSALSTASGERGEIKTEVAVERTRNDNTEKWLEKIDKKLDKLLLK